MWSSFVSWISTSAAGTIISKGIDACLSMFSQKNTEAMKSNAEAMDAAREHEHGERIVADAFDSTKGASLEEVRKEAGE